MVHRFDEREIMVRSSIAERREKNELAPVTAHPRTKAEDLKLDSAEQLAMPTGHATARANG